MDYDIQNVVEEVRGIAQTRLTGEVTVEILAWDDGDYQITAFHTIDATYPFEAVERGEGHGLPFYRERLVFQTSGESEGWIVHEVVRRTCGETAFSVMWSERVGGYTFNWPNPLDEDDDEDDDENPVYPGPTFPGRVG